MNNGLVEATQGDTTQDSSMDNSYPTPKEIMDNKPKIDKQFTKTLLIWKRAAYKNWKKQTNHEKLDKLDLLIHMLNIVYSEIFGKYKEIFISYFLETYAYDQKHQMIEIDPHNPSIISTLHELAHHFFGKNERKATKWSIHLFKKCFPIEAKKLRWQRHMLIK